MRLLSVSATQIDPSGPIATPRGLLNSRAPVPGLRSAVPQSWRNPWLRQVPAWQTVPVAQMLPQVPQLFSSSWVSLQVPEQTVYPAGQMQALPPQISLPPQTLPQAPQLEASVVRSTQPAPQEVWLDSLQMQVPAEQIAPDPQMFPHAPQLLASLRVSMHAPLQEEKGVGHTQEPDAQCSLTPHALSQAPQ